MKKYVKLRFNNDIEELFTILDDNCVVYDLEGKKWEGKHELKKYYCYLSHDKKPIMGKPKYSKDEYKIKLFWGGGLRRVKFTFTFSDDNLITKVKIKEITGLI